MNQKREIWIDDDVKVLVCMCDEKNKVPGFLYISEEVYKYRKSK